MEIKTSRSLESLYRQRDSFRIEKKMVYDEQCYDLIWQANGDEEGIAILLDKKDLKQLYNLISSQGL